MSKRLEQAIKDVGLTDNQASVYLAALAIGPSSAQRISSVSGVKRTTVYPVFEQLKELGLMSVSFRGWKKCYVAENPKKLEELIELRRVRFKENFPELEHMFSIQGRNSQLKFFEGVEGVKKAYDLLITDLEHGDYYDIFGGDSQRWIDEDPDYFRRFFERRRRINNNVRVITTQNEAGRYYKKQEGLYHKEVKFLPNDSADINTSITVTPHRVHIHQFSNPIMVIVIENLSVVRLQKIAFDIIWGALE